jgi:hypothetical protein
MLAQQLIDQAVAETGLHDFGGDSFREGLEVLVRALQAEANLNARGEAVIYPRLVLHLAQRLQVEDWYRRHPEIEEVPVTAPLFGLGLPRTGSTALAFLLSRDPAIRYLHQWEASQPCPPPYLSSEHDARLEYARGEKVGTRAHVPVDAEGPMECLDLLALDFRTEIYEAFARIPSYADWLFEADLTSAYLYQRRVLKLLNWRGPDRPWRLKAPTHARHLPALLAAFPDARFVMTHRDPTDVMVSLCEVFADIQGGFTDEVDLRTIGEINVTHWARAMERVVEFRAAGHGHLFYDVDFRAVLADPIGEVRGLYAWLGAEVTPEFEAGMQAWWAQNSAREASPRGDAATYHLDLDRVRPLFADYVKHAEEWCRHGS